MEGRRNVFISHVHEDDDRIPELKSLVGSRGYELSNYSIDSSRPNEATSESYIKYEILKPRIDAASTIIVLIAPSTHQSWWVNWEIECAFKAGKRIVGVYVRGGMESDLPAAFVDCGHALVGWQAASIIDAIEGRIDNWRKPSGEPVEPRPIDHHNC